MQENKNLLTAAIMHTDAYLGVLKTIESTGHVTMTMEVDFWRNIGDAERILKQLGIEHYHTEYINRYKELFDILMHVKELETQTSVNESILPLRIFFESTNDFELEKMADAIDWSDIIDTYDEDDLEDSEDEPEDNEVSDITEKISVQSRLKRKQSFRRFSPKRNLARSIKLRRASSMDVLKKRAVLTARRVIMKKMLRGRDKASMSAAEKDMIEQRLKRMRFLQASLAIRLIPKIRQIEQKRLSHR